MPDDRSREPCLGFRHALAILGGLGLTLGSAQHDAFPVALYAMVNDSKPLVYPDVNASATDCPLPPNLTAFDFPKAPHSGIFTWPASLLRLLLMGHTLGTLLPLVLVGWLAQRFGGRWFFLIGILSHSISSLLTPTLAWIEPWSLLGMRLLAGMGDATCKVSLMAMFGRWAPRDEVTRLVVAVSVGPALGSVFSGLAAGYIVNSENLGGWPEVFYLFGGITFVWVPLWIGCTADSPSLHRLISPAERYRIASSIGPHRQAAVNAHDGVPWTRMLCDRAVWVYFAAMFAYGFVALTNDASLAQFLGQVLHFDVRANSLLTALPPLTEVVIAVLVARLTDAIIWRCPTRRTAIRKTLTVLAFGGPAACLIAITQVGCQQWPVVGLLILSAAFVAIGASGVLVLPLDLSLEFCGTLFGFGATASVIGRILAAIVVDAAAEFATRRAWTVVYSLGAVLAAAAGILFLVLGSAERCRWASYQVLNDSEAMSTKEERPRSATMMKTLTVHHTEGV